MYIYFIPVYAQSFGANFFDLGVIGTINALGYAITPAIVGMIADRSNRAWLFVSGLALNAVSAAILVVAGSVSDIALLRLFGGFAFAFFWPTSEILVSDLAPVEARVREIGRYSVAWSSGILVGPFIGGYMLERSTFVTLFAAAGVVTALGLIPAVVRLIPGYKRQDQVLPKLSMTTLSMKALAPWYVVSIGYGAIFSTVVAIFPGHAHNLGFLPTAIGALFTMLGISRALVFGSTGRIERFGDTRLLLLAAAGLGGSLILLGAFEFYLNLGVGMILLGASFGIVFPILLAIIARGFPPERLGLAIGSYETMFGIGFVIGPIMAGAVAYATSASVALLATSLYALAMIGSILVGKRGGLART